MEPVIIGLFLKQNKNTINPATMHDITMQICSNVVLYISTQSDVLHSSTSITRNRIYSNTLVNGAQII